MNFNKTPRIAIFGGPATGKSVLAIRLGLITGIEPIHIDDLHWLENWVEKERKELRNEISKIVERDTWIIDGNYSKVRDLVLKRANLAIILRPPLYLTLWRLWWRTFFRWFSIKPSWITRRPKNVVGINPKEGIIKSFSILADAVFKYYNYKSQLVYAQAKANEVKTIIVTSPKQYQSLLE